MNTNTIKVAATLVQIPGSSWSWVYLQEAAELLGNPEAIVWASFRDSCASGKSDQFAYCKGGVWHIMKVNACEEQDNTVIFNVETVLLPAGWLTQALKKVKSNRLAPLANAKLQHLALLKDHKVNAMAGWRQRGCPLGGCAIHTRNCNAIAEQALSALGVNPIIADVEDEFFNHLAFELAMTWEARFVEAFDPSVDQQEIWRQFALFMLTDANFGARVCTKTAAQAGLVDEVIALAERNAAPSEWEAVHLALFHAYQSYYTEDEIYDEVVRLDPDYKVLYSAYQIAGIFLYGEKYPSCAGEAIRSLAQAHQPEIFDDFIHPNEAAVKAMADKFIEIVLAAKPV